VRHHGEGLRRITKNDELVQQLELDWRKADFNDADKAMLAYVEKLTLKPWDMVEEDVTALRKASFSDAAILDINQVTGYYAFVNRLADGLGVQLETIYKDGT